MLFAPPVELVMTLGQRIKQRRDHFGWTQTELANMVKRTTGYPMTQAAISKFELDLTKRPRGLPELARTLRVTEPSLRTGAGFPQEIGDNAGFDSVQPHAKIVPEPVRTDVGSEIPLYSLSQGADGSEMILKRRPVRETIRCPDRLEKVRGVLAVYIPDDTMSPSLKVGHIGIVHPTRPAEVGDECLFIGAESNAGEFVVIRELVRVSLKSWRVRQHNPPREYDLQRSEWSRAHVIVERRRI